MKLVFISVILSIVTLSTTLACSCSNFYANDTTQLIGAAKGSDYVILAKVEYVKDSLYVNNLAFRRGQNYWRKGGYNPVVKVKKVYKGTIKKKTMEITTDWSNCSEFFKIGETYVIFGYKDKEGSYSTNICLLNFPMTDKRWWDQFKNLKKTLFL